MWGNIKKCRRHKMKIFTGVLIILLIVTSGYAAEYYGAKTGNDSNPGTEARPWKTIKKAADTMTAGDSVLIKAGVYNERVRPRYSGTAGEYITYTSYPNDTVVIDGSGIDLPDDWGGIGGYHREKLYQSFGPADPERRSPY
jgi:hypothetical protein